jgi:histidinol-phosphate phosphatase family protein
MKVVIMAGGKGTRIASMKSDVPKPMIEICGKPILLWQIECLQSQGLTDITLVTGHLGHVISDFFGTDSRFGVNISYYSEDIPLGTAGALFKMPWLTEDFLLMCGDVILDVDFRKFANFHKDKKAWASLMAHPNDHPYDSSLLVTEIIPPQEPGGMPIDTHRVTRWMNKEDERLWYKNLVNAGIEMISPELLREAKKKITDANPGWNGKADLDRDVLKPNIQSGHIFAYHTTEYIKDMGTPERFYEVERDIKSGKVKARNMASKQKAVFIDRDGTINKYVGFLTKPEQMTLIPGVAEAVRMINESGYLAIVVTNQPVISRGECTLDCLQDIHNKMETELGKAGAYVDAIYVCPHHKDKGFDGELPEYKFECNCRKPKPGLLLQAASDWNIDLSQSIMIGDSDNDIIAGENAGCRHTIKATTDDCSWKDKLKALLETP